MRNLTLAAVAACALALGLGSAQGSTINLTMDIPSPGAWNVFATCSSDCAGIASFIVSVTGTGDIVITGSTMKAPRKAGYSFGFSSYSNGVNGVGVLGGQGTVYQAPNDPEMDALVLQGIGITSGSFNYGTGSVSWNAPVLLAAGTYTGTAGNLHLAVGNAQGQGQFNVLNNVSGDSWVGPGNVSVADVTFSQGANASVPEPATLALLASGCAFLFRRRRAA